MGRIANRLIALFVFAGACVAQTYTARGEFVVPQDYREWIFLAAGIDMTYSGQASARPMFGNVFVNPAAYRAFLKTGSWPDKTVLLIENRASENNPLASHGKFQTNLAGFEAHVKDASRGGWSFYLIRPGEQSGKAIAAKETCARCHQQHGAVDTTFVQFYPTLIDAARKNGTYREPKY